MKPEAIMDFSAQKIQRCGIQALRPYRKQAACIVFFTVLLPWAVVIAGVAAVLAIRTDAALPAGKWAGIAAAAWAFLVHAPLRLGVKRWYLEICRPGNLRNPSVFFFFSSVSRYWKAVAAGVLSFGVKAALLLGCSVPGAVSCIVSAVCYRNIAQPLVQSLCLLCLLAGIGLLGCAGALWGKICGKLQWWEWLLARAPSLTISGLWRETADFWKTHKTMLRLIRRRTGWKKALCCLVLPAIWLLPQAHCTVAACLCTLFPQPEPNRTFAPFRPRKIHPSRRKRTILPAQ